MIMFSLKKISPHLNNFFYRYNIIIMSVYYNYIFLCLIILFSLYDGTISFQKESFTPGIKRFYRPYIRKTRFFAEGFMNTTKNNMARFFRQMGLI